jgi:hypothetical protein
MLRALVHRCNMISFQIEIGAPSGDLGMGLTGRPVDVRDLPTADLVLCQLRAAACRWRLRPSPNFCSRTCRA